MDTSIIMLIAGLAGFIVCEIISLITLRFSRQMQAIAWIFGWLAMTGIIYSATKTIFPESIVMATLSAVVAALVVMLLVTILIWCWFLAEKIVKVCLTELSKCFK